MSEEIHVISDGEGVIIVGNPTVVDSFARTEGFLMREVDLTRLWAATSLTGAAFRAVEETATKAGRWMKLSAESATAVKKYGLMKSSSSGLEMGVIHSGGQAGIKGVVQFAKGSGALLSPAALAGVGGIMAQVAMQQQMDAISDYLAVIDEKLDDLLRMERDRVMADLDAVALVLDEAVAVHGAVGRVSDVTWSKVQATHAAIAAVQARALRELDAIASKVERAARLSDKADAARKAAADAPTWLALLARSFSLNEQLSVVELDRVLDDAPDEIDRHRLGLAEARRRRVATIEARTLETLARMHDAGAYATARTLAHPRQARVAVEASNRVVDYVGQLHTTLGIEAPAGTEFVRWRDAAAKAGEDLGSAGQRGIAAAGRFTSDAADGVATALEMVQSAGRSGSAKARDTLDGAAGAASDAVGRARDNLARKVRRRKT